MNTKSVHSDKHGNRSLRQLICGLLLFSSVSLAHAVTLDEISYTSLPSNEVLLRLSFSDTVPGDPTSFIIDEPARIALDFPAVAIGAMRKSADVNVGMVNSVTAVEADGRTRVVVNMTRMVPYDVEIDGSEVLLTVSGAAGSVSQAFGAEVMDVDFDRGEDGAGRIRITLSDPSTAIDLSEEGGKVVVKMLNTSLPDALDRKLDVVNFATPVKEIDTRQDDQDVRMTISTLSDEYEHLAYQTDNVYLIEFKPLSAEELQEKRHQKKLFTGERLSLNFQSIDVRAVLQLLAEYQNFNLVVSDTVGGTITIRLKNVPWDQAMDIILRARGLGKRQTGNVVVVAPQAELAAQERLELESMKQIETLAPLRTEYISISYAQADSLANLIQKEGSNLLSDRGTVSIDQRTNTLIIQDTASSLEAIRALVNKLDVPVRQVLIESRIVNADNNFTKDIGVRFGYSKHTKKGVTGSSDLSKSSMPYVAFGGTIGGDTGKDGLMVDLPATADSAGSLALQIGKVGSYLLQLELSALIAEGRGEEIASPRVITANQTEALIESGVQIPYQEASSSGATAVSFKDATLSLRVTPQITPDEKVFMRLQVEQDTVSSRVVNGVPAINTKSVSSQVLVDSGETVVLGGIYENTDKNSTDRVPFFSDLPYLGFLFKRTEDVRSKTELLIFVTPKILKEGMSI